MILPIVAYGDPILKQEAEDITKEYPQLDTLIEDMFETMKNAYGVGLAAPQVGLGIRLFVVDTTPFAEAADEEEDAEERKRLQALEGFKRVFINPIIVEEDGEKWAFNEGCLSIPGIREDVLRREKIVIEYYDEQFQLKEEEFDGYKARVIQHEYDHIEGVLFTDRLNPIRKQFLKKKLNDIAVGKVNADYKMRFAKR
ncbi:MAG: peptide deformylase [Flavobacteriales bacterium]